MAIRPVPGRALWGAALLIPALLWGLCAFRAHRHFRIGCGAGDSSKALEAGREFESAIGFYAPLNPWSRSAAEALAALASEQRAKDPALAFELEGRLRRAVRGTRWLVQPYGDILASLDADSVPLPRDPDPFLFLLSLMGLATACGAPWMGRWTVTWRWVVTGGGLLVWAAALRLC